MGTNLRTYFVTPNKIRIFVLDNGEKIELT